jgi:hypothetical protein
VTGTRIGRTSHALSENRPKARSIAPLDGLPIPIRIRLPSVYPGLDAMKFGVVYTVDASSGWPSAAMVPILRKNVGGDKPQHPVRKSKRFCDGVAGVVLAMVAGNEAA